MVKLHFLENGQHAYQYGLTRIIMISEALQKLVLLNRSNFHITTKLAYKSDAAPSFHEKFLLSDMFSKLECETYYLPHFLEDTLGI